MIEYYPPTSPGEWVSTLCAAVTVLIGLLMFIAPGIVVRAMGLVDESVDKSIRAAIRSHPAGLLIGFGLSALLLQQPLLYLALGISWGFSALGQLNAMVIHKKFSVAYLAALAAKTVLATMITLAVLGYFG